MRRIRFGRTNVQVPVVSLGTWGHGGERRNEGVAVGWSGHDDTKAKEALVLAWRDGITHWDTADAYGDGHAEELIGEVLASDVPRNEIFLASKVGWIKGPSGHWYDPKFMREQCERSLRNMRTDVIDLYYFHHCMFGEHDEYFDNALAMMQTLRDEGKIRFIGLSDWDASQIMKFIGRVNPDVVQPYRNLVDDDYESSGLKAYVDGHDLGVAFFSPLKHGLLLGKYTETQAFTDGDFRSGVADFRDPAAIARYRRASEEVHRRFSDREEPVLGSVVGALLTGNQTATVLLGQRNARQTEAAAKIGDALSESDAAWVRGLYRGE